MARSPLRPTGVQDADFYPLDPNAPVAQDAFLRHHELEGEFSRGLRTGAAQNSVGALNREALDAELEGDIATMQARRQRAQTIQQESQPFAPRVGSLRDIGSVDDAQDFAEGAIGQGVASMLGPMAGSVAGSLLLRKPVGALAGSAIPSFQAVKGEAVTGQYDDPALAAKTAEERNRVANISSAGGAALESIVPAGVGRILTRPATQAARRSATGAVAGSMITEGAAEAAQTGMQFAGEKYLDPDRELDPMDVADAFAAGALTGGAVTGGASGTRAAIDNALPMAQRGLERTADRVSAARDRMAAARSAVSREPVPLDSVSASDRVAEARNKIAEAQAAGQDPMAAVFADEDSEAAVALSTQEGRSRLIDTAVKAFPDDPTAQVEAVKQATATASQRLRDRLVQNPAVSEENRARLSQITDFSDPQAHAAVVEAHAQTQAQEDNRTTFKRMAAAAQRLTGKRSDFGGDRNFGGDRTTGEQPTARDTGRMRWVRQAMLRAAANKDAQAKAGKEAKRGAQIDERDAAQDQVDRVRVATKQALLASLPAGMAVDKDTQAFISDTADTLLTMAARTTVPKGMIEPIEDAWQRFNELYGEQAPKIAQTIMKQVPQDETQRSIMAQLVEGSKPAVAEFATETSVFNRNLTTRARNMSPQALRKLARLVDDFASMDGNRDADALMPMFDAAFGGRERALAVLDHYASPLRETIRPDTGAAESDMQQDAEEGDAIDTFSDNVTVMDGPQRTYVFQEGTQGRPFLANSTEMTEQLNKMVATGVFNEASVTPIPFSDYVYDQVGETLQDAEQEAKRMYKDIQGRLQKVLDELATKIRKEINESQSRTPEQEKLWQDTNTSGKQTSAMATKRRNAIRKALNDGVVDFPKDGGDMLRGRYLALQQQMQEFAGRYRAGGPVHALDMFQVLAVEGGTDSVAATADELRAWGKKPKAADTRQLEGEAKRVKADENKTLSRMAIKFNRDKGNPITIYVPSIIAEAHGRRDPSDTEGVLGFNRSVVMEAIAKVLATPGVTGIQTDLGGIVMGRQGGLDLTNTLLTAGQIMQLLEPAPTPNPTVQPSRPPALRRYINEQSKPFRARLNQRVAELVKTQGSGYDPEVGAVSLYLRTIQHAEQQAGEARGAPERLAARARAVIAREAMQDYLNLVFPLPAEAQFDANLILEEDGQSVADVFRGNTQEQQTLQAKEAELSTLRDRLSVIEEAAPGIESASVSSLIDRMYQRVQKLEEDVANQDTKLAASDERMGIRTGARDVDEATRAQAERDSQKVKEDEAAGREPRQPVAKPKPVTKGTAPKTAKQAQREKLAQDARAFKGKVTKGDDDTSKAQTDAKKAKLLSPAEALRKRTKDLRTTEQKASMKARQEKIDREKTATADAEKRFGEMVTKWDDDRLARFKGPGEMQNRVVEAERARRNNDVGKRAQKLIDRIDARKDWSGEQAQTALDMLSVLLPDLKGKPELAAELEKRVQTLKKKLEATRDGLRNSLVRPLEANELSQKDRDDIIAQVAKMRGKKVTVEFVKALEIGGASGTWTPDRLIRIATTASNPMSVAYHEAMHDFFNTLGGNKEERAIKEKLLRVSGRPTIVYKMVSLLKNHPEALKALNSDPEERLAYMFQLWQMGKLDLAGDSQSFFTKVAQAIRNLLGTVSEMKQAEALFNALAEGKFAEPSTVAQVAMGVAPGQTAGEKAAFLLEPIRRFAHDTMVKVPTDRLRDTGIKPLAELADAFEPAVGKPGMGMLQSRIQKTDQFLNKMAKVFEGTTASERKAAVRNLQAMKPPASPLERRITALLDELFTYMKESGVQTMRQQPAYEVRLEMADNLSSRTSLQTALAGMKLKGAPKDKAGNAKFILQKVARGELTPDQLPAGAAQAVANEIATAGPGKKSWVPISKAKKYFPRVWDPNVIADKREQFLETFSKYMPEKEAEQAYLALVNGSHSVDLTENEHHLGFTPFAEALIGRKFEFINDTNAHEFVDFQQADPIEILSTYIQQAAHRGEYAKTFGNQGEVIEQALAQAATAGATPEELAMSRKAVLSLEGTLGHQFDPKLRALQTQIITYQNVVLLPVSLFSQFIDALGVGLRTGDIKESFTSFKNGMRDIARAVSRSDKKDEAQEMARLIGIISDENMLANMGQVYSGMYMSKGVKEVNRLFFKFNGMELWNRSMRTSAMMAGHRFIIRNKDNARYMDELGVKPADVIELPDGKLAVFKADIQEQLMSLKPNLTDKQREAEAARIEQVMHQALFKFVDSAVVRPRASHRPIWMSDPRFMLIAHLKQFAFSFQHTYLSRVKHEFDYGNLTPALHLAFFVPFMLAADTARFILTGTGPRYENMDAYSMFTTALARSGVLGVGEFGLAMERDLGRGDMPGSSLLGPTADHLLTLGQTALGAGSIEHAADRTIPFLKVLGSISGRVTGG